MTPKEIKIELMKADVSQAQIAQECDVSHTQVWRIIHKPEVVSDKVRRCIASHIGRDVADIWPEYYLARAVA